jgi:hypothetical protein
MRYCVLILSLMLIMLSVEGSDTFSLLPKNSMKIPVGNKSISAIDEVAFNKILDEVEKVYRPIFKARGANLVIERKWQDGTVNAYAFQQGRDWHVAMFGGLARHRLLNHDGFMSVACHEFGHHLGGSPRRGWAAVDGQSDYFSTSKCMKRVLDQRAEIEASEPKDKDDKFGFDKCSEVYHSEKEIRICQKILVAGKSLAAVLSSLAGGRAPLLTTPDRSIISRTDTAHPQAQCRLDTFFQGAICDRPYDEDFDRDDERVGACEGLGSRPLCWYAPAK